MSHPTGTDSHDPTRRRLHPGRLRPAHRPAAPSRQIRHPFAGLLALTSLGLLCRQPDFASIARWARRHWAELAGPLGFTRDDAPHATTLSRAAARYSVAEFRAALAGWLGAAGRRRAGRRRRRQDEQRRPAAATAARSTVLNVFAHGKLALADWPVGGDKKTEPDVLRAHLDALFAAYPGLRALTGDALFCRRPPGPSDRRGRAGLRPGGQGEPARAARGGPGRLRRRDGRLGRGGDAREKRGAVVVRRIWCDTASADYARAALSFPGLRVLARVDCETRPRVGAATTETRYFACGLDPARMAPARLLGLVRGHWQVENSLHYEKDRWWDEDRHVCRRPGLAAGFTTLLTAALTALRATGCDVAEGSMRGAADALCWDVGRAISLITGTAL